MSDVMIEECPLRGMVSLRGDFASAAFQKALHGVTGLDVPTTRRIVTHKDGSVAWMSPDELLLMMSHDQADAVVSALEDSLSGEHHLAANVSDARACFRIQGWGAHEVLAKGAPVDLAPEVFHPGEIRRTRLGQVAVAFWMTGEDAFELVCFRSVAAFVSDWLQMAARPGSFPDVFNA